MTTNDFNEQERLNAKEQEINDKLNSVAQDLRYFKFGTVAIQICFLIEVINIIKLGKPLTSDCFAFVFNSVLLLASFPVQVTTTVLTCLANVFNKSANGSAPVLEPEAVPSPTQITSGFFSLIAYCCKKRTPIIISVSE